MIQNEVFYSVALYWIKMGWSSYVLSYISIDCVLFGDQRLSSDSVLRLHVTQWSKLLSVAPADKKIRGSNDSNTF